MSEISSTTSDSIHDGDSVPTSDESSVALPISHYRAEILQALQKHQVLIICGETGSGKSTQLPQYLYEAQIIPAIQGNDAKALAEAIKTIGRIGHTQPRRMAAMSLSKRINSELKIKGAPEGVVGWKIRFEDHIAPHSAVKMMTDGILIAETASDKLLSGYRTIIVDEAHERSLNIDFLLGYLKNLLPKRPDLNVIITSATLEAEKFSAFFNHAPVLQVEGRSYPVTVWYRSIEGTNGVKAFTDSAKEGWDEVEKKAEREAWREEKHEEKLPRAIFSAIEELWSSPIAMGGGVGDVLVFLPGEMEIRTVGEYLQGALTKLPGGLRKMNVEVLPLFSRLSSADQMRIFHPTTSAPRIILSTNIAETSLTVPRIRFVIDSGLSRVLRYSPRLKINRLEIEPIAHDAARQRAGRCGRLSAGICVRLYDEAEFQLRPSTTTPEILRSSLALVILRMLSLDLGDVRAFPWLSEPSSRMIHYGLTELIDLGAIGVDGKLTTMGAKMARLPIDHTLSRMIISAKDWGVLSEILIIISALSTREVREVPISPTNEEERARAAHRAFADERSDFLSLLHLWRHIEKARARSASNGEFRKWCKANYLSWFRIREWRELHLQMVTQVSRVLSVKPDRSKDKEHTVTTTIPQSDEKPTEKNNTHTINATTDKAIHQAILSGLPWSLGKKHETEAFYLGPRGLKFFADRRWATRKAHFVLAGEIVATPRPIARKMAKMDPRWVVETIPHLLTFTNLEPYWDRHQGAVMIHRQISLQGLMIEPRQKVCFAPTTADEWQKGRELLIQGALIEDKGELPTILKAVMKENAQTIKRLTEREHQARRPGAIMDDQKLLSFYAQAIPLECLNMRALARFFRENPQAVDTLKINEEEWLQGKVLGAGEDFPGEWVVGDGQAGEIVLPIRYTFAPSEADDGMTVTVHKDLWPLIPKTRTEWLVPGLLPDKVEALIKSLPKRLRFLLREVAGKFVVDTMTTNIPHTTALIPALADYCTQSLGQKINVELFREEHIPQHLKMRFVLVDDTQRVLIASRSILAINTFLQKQAKFVGDGNDTDREQHRDSIGHNSHAKASSFAQLATLIKPTGAEKSSATKINVVRPNLPTSATTYSTHYRVDEEEATPITAWTIGPWPATRPMTIAGQTILGHIALTDKNGVVEIGVYANKEEANSIHKMGLVALAKIPLSTQINAFMKRAPNLLKLGIPTQWFSDEKKWLQGIVHSAIAETLLSEPLPTNAKQFDEKIKDTKNRFLLVADSHLALWQKIARAYKDTHQLLEKSIGAYSAIRVECVSALQALIADPAFQMMKMEVLKHYPRYLQGIAMRIEKYPKNPERDKKNAIGLLAIQRQIQQAVQSGRLSSEQQAYFRFLVWELNIQLFAESLKTALPISLSRLEKILSETLRG